MRVAIIPVSWLDGRVVIEVGNARYMSARFLLGNDEEMAVARAVAGIKRAEQRLANALDRLARRDAKRRELGFGVWK